MKSSVLLSTLVTSALGFLDLSSSRVDIGSVCLSSVLHKSESSSATCSKGFSHNLESGANNSAGKFPWTAPVTCSRNGTASTGQCIFHSKNFGNGRGISIVTDESRAAHIADSPAFKSPKSMRGRNVLNPKTKIVQIPGKGYGMVATEIIHHGEPIISETVAVLVDYNAYLSMPHEVVKKMQADAVDLLPVAGRNIFLNMSTHNEELAHLEKVEKILVTNAFDVNIDDGVNEGFYAVFPLTARMNHDCRPNVDYYFDDDTLTQYSTAIRDIQAGEELTLSYIDGMKSRAERQAHLQGTWGFKCSCHACSAPRAQTRESDARIVQIAAIRKELSDFSTKSRATPQMAELLISLYEQERMYGLYSDAYTLAAIEWNGVGEPWLATKYARLAIEHGIASSGADNSDVVAMKDLARDPWDHWTWMLRTKKRMGWSRDVASADN